MFAVIRYYLFPRESILVQRLPWWQWRLEKGHSPLYLFLKRKSEISYEELSSLYHCTFIDLKAELFRQGIRWLPVLFLIQWPCSSTTKRLVPLRRHPRQVAANHRSQFSQTFLTSLQLLLPKHEELKSNTALKK